MERMLKMGVEAAPWLGYAGFAAVDRPAWGGVAAGLAWLCTRIIYPKLITELDGAFGLFFVAIASLGFAFPEWTQTYAGAVLFGVLGGMSLATTLAGRPFVLRYAKKDVASSHWEHPHFKRAVEVVAWVWTAVFWGAAVLAAFYGPRLVGAWQLWFLTGSCLAFGAAFTWFFPRWYRRRVFPLPDPETES